MKQVFDLLEAINEKAEEFFQATEQTPRVVSVSPRAYRRLIEIRHVDLIESGQEAVLTAIETITTSVGVLRIRIDETISDLAIEVA